MCCVWFSGVHVMRAHHRSSHVCLCLWPERRLIWSDHMWTLDVFNMCVIWLAMTSVSISLCHHTGAQSSVTIVTGLRVTQTSIIKHWWTFIRLSSDLCVCVWWSLIGWCKTNTYLSSSSHNRCVCVRSTVVVCCQRSLVWSIKQIFIGCQNYEVCVCVSESHHVLCVV